MLGTVLSLTMIATSFGTTALAAEESEVGGVLNYVYVESPDLSYEDSQNIVVSYETSSEYTEADLVTIADDGTEVVLDCTKNIDGLYLFNRTYSEEEMGTYTIDRLILTDENGIEEISLVDSGFEAEFNVYNADTAYAVSYSVEEPEGTVAIEDPEEAEDKVAEALAEATYDGEVSIETEPMLAKAGEDADKDINTVDEKEQFVVCLDPGHDGISPGAQANGYGEEVLVLSIAQYCKEELEKNGVKVIMTRNGMECPLGVTSRDNHNESLCLQKRIDIGAEAKADVLVSFHLNAAGSPYASGAEVYYPSLNYRPGIGVEGEKLAQDIQNELTALGLTNRGIKLWQSSDDYYPDGSVSDYLAIVRESKESGMPGILIEHAFITSNNDISNYLSSEAGLKSLGVADAKGILKYKETYPGKQKFKDGWISTSDGWIYSKEDGTKAKGWLDLKEGRYYLDSYGIMATGWVAVGDKWYYMNSSGVMQKNGWFNIEGKQYYLYEDGHMACDETVDGEYVDIHGAKVTISSSSWERDDYGWKYIDENKAFVKSCFKEIDGETYYFGADAYMLKDWNKIDGKWYYFKGSGAMVKNCWLTISGEDYYFYEDGHMASDETVNGYYVNKSGAYRRNSWEHDGYGWWYSLGKGGYPKNSFEVIGGNTFYFDAHGYMAEGWAKVDGKWYYFDGSGHMIKDCWKWIGDYCYYFYEDGHMAVSEEIDGSFVNASGAWAYDQWVNNGYGWWYSYGKGGYPAGEFKDINGNRFYFYESGYMAEGWAKVDGTWYYFDGAGHMLRGWLDLNGTWYYLDSNGKMTTGWQEIEGKWYYMDESGAWQRDKERPVEDQEISSENFVGYTILGTSNVTAEKLAKVYKDNSPVKYPADELAKGGAPTIEDFSRIFYEEAVAENIKPEVAFAQAMLETGWLKFGADVKISQFNFAGLGAVGGGAQGADFSSFGKDGVRMGVRAQIQHLKAYATDSTDLANECVDPRYDLVKPKGSAIYVEWLGQKENPNGKGWATGENYGPNIMNIVNKIIG